MVHFETANLSMFFIWLESTQATKIRPSLTLDTKSGKRRFFQSTAFMIDRIYTLSYTQK